MLFKLGIKAVPSCVHIQSHSLLAAKLCNISHPGGIGLRDRKLSVLLELGFVLCRLWLCSVSLLFKKKYFIFRDVKLL